MKIRRSFLCCVWLCLTLGFSFLEAYANAYKNTEDGDVQDNNDKQKRQRTKIKKKKEKPPVILPPPTVYQYRPLSKTRRLLNKIRMGPARLLKTNKNETNLHLLQNQNLDHDYNPRLGFEMAVLSGLSYWEFHKKDPPENATGFALLESTPKLSPLRNKIRKYRTKFRSYRAKIKNRCSVLIRDSFPIARSLKRLGGNTTSAAGDANSKSSSSNNNNNKNTNKNPFYTLEYSFYNWHEPTNIKGVSFHDTDVLISTANNGNALIIAFAGSASPADVVTNVQTFEPANHSLFFEPQSNLSKEPRFWKNDNVRIKTNDSGKNATQTQGSLHRGFLNAYSRVERGNVLRILTKTHHATNNTESDTTTSSHLLPKSMRWWRGPIKEHHRKRGETNRRKTTKPHILDSLNRRFGHCHANASERMNDESYNDDDTNDDNNHDDENSTTDKSTKKRKKKKRYSGCKVTEKAGGESPIRLSFVLKELVETAISNGYQVHITGHSLGGALATLLVLDVLANENIVELDNHVNNLYLWTYGAPQIADLLFWESLLVHSPKLRRFLLGNEIPGKRKTHNGSAFRQYIHRYVTLGDDGKVDAISEVAKNTLAAHKESSTLSDITKDTEQQELPVQGNSNQRSHDNNDSDEQSTKKKWPDAIHGKFAQSIGGVSSGSEVTHFIDAHYLWTPDQQQKQLERNQQEQMKQLQELENHLTGQQQTTTTAKPEGETVSSMTDSVTDTRSSMHAHSIRNYLMGISRESGPDQHPLIPDLPLEWLEYLEIVSKK